MKRSVLKEIMDDFSINDNRIDNALIELKYINKFLGGNSVSSRGLKYFDHNKPLTILDIGAGASDILLSLKNTYSYRIFAIDKSIRACGYLRHNTSIKNIICGDVHNLPLNKKFDIIHCSLFLHHFKQEELVSIISSLINISDKGIIINDLRRSVFAYAGIKAITKIFSKSDMVKHDGPLSVKRGFIKKDLVSILNRLKGVNYTIKRMWAFRWLVVIKINTDS